MSNPLGPAAFFALEAGECLDRLDKIFTSPQGPAPEEIIRTARALRGSALMANQPQLARAAGGFEALGRVLRDKKRTWDAATREQAGQAIEEYRLLVRRVPEWQETDAARAARVAAFLESLAGQGPLEAARLRTAPPGELQTGVRAFVAREGALIASALDRAARAYRAEPDDREPLYMVLRRMQSLQGLAELPDFPAAARDSRRHRARRGRSHPGPRGAARRGRGARGRRGGAVRAWPATSPSAACPMPTPRSRAASPSGCWKRSPWSATSCLSRRSTPRAIRRRWSDPRARRGSHPRPRPARSSW